MDVMPILGWGLLVVLAAMAVAIFIMARRHARLVSMLQARIEVMSADAGRLPDVLERATRAESRVEGLLTEARNAAAREAEVRARIEVAIQGQERQMAVVIDRDAVIDALRHSLDTRQAELASALATADARLAELSSMREEMAVTRQSRDAASSSCDEARREAAVMAAKADGGARELMTVIAERDDARGDLRRTQANLQAALTAQASAISERDAARDALQETKAFLNEAKTQLKTAFTEAASQVFDEKSIALEQRIQASAELSKMSVEATLKPFAEKVGAFQNKVEQLSAEQSRDHATLVGTIGELKGLNQNMADAAGQLTRALKGNAKTRGDWGELILETVLKGSGLEEGTNFETQMHAVDDETGQRKYPDVVVKLPDGRKVVVDSKLNLIAWSDAQNAQTPGEQSDELIRHAAALRQHMRELSEKNYPHIVGSEALDLTILFVPIEGALSAALSVNPDLQTDAFERKVVFATPNTLMAMLRVVERLWTRDRIQRQVSTINEEATKLLDAIGAFLDDFEAVDTRLRQTSDAYAKAKGRLSDSNRSVLFRARRLVEAGARPRRSKREEISPVAGSDEPALGVDGDSPNGDTG